MNNLGDMLMLALLSIAMGALIGGSFVYDMMREELESSAIQNECARYNPTTGEFEWHKN